MGIMPRYTAPSDNNATCCCVLHADNDPDNATSPLATRLSRRQDREDSRGYFSLNPRRHLRASLDSQGIRAYLKPRLGESGNLISEARLCEANGPAA